MRYLVWDFDGTLGGRTVGSRSANASLAGCGRGTFVGDFLGGFSAGGKMRLQDRGETPRSGTIPTVGGFDRMGRSEKLSYVTPGEGGLQTYMAGR